MKRLPNVPQPEIRPRLFLEFTDPELESHFKRFYANFYYRFAQASLGLGLLLVLGDYLVDFFAYPDLSANFYRLSLCAPLLIAALAYSFLSHARQHWEKVMTTLITVIAMSMFWVLLSIDEQNGQGLKSWVGILNFTILELYCFVILGARFRHALPSGIAILVCYEYAMYIGFEGNIAQVGYLSYHGLTMALICAMIGWWREFLLRKNFAAEFAVQQTAERLELKRSLLEATLDASNSGILVVNAQGEITSVNKRFSHMWRIPEAIITQGDDKQVLAFALEQLIDPKQFLKKVEDLYQRPEAISRDKLHFTDGRVFSRYSHPQKLRDQIVGRVWSFLDITDQVRAEERVLQLTNAITQELAASENHRGQLQALLQAIPDLVWMKDAQGVFLSCNAAFEKLIGAPVTQVIGKTDADFMPMEAVQDFLAHDRLAAESQSPITYEEWVDFQGENRKVLLETTKVAVRDQQGRLIGVLGVARDVTNVRALMKDLETAKNAAQESNEAKSMFLANMSHEIRTPMNAIIGMADLALNTELNPRQRNYINKIKLASHGLMHVINDILDFSKIEAGKIQLESIHFELDDVFEGLSGLLALRAENQGIELAYSVGQGIPEVLIGDSLRLGQVLTNLVSNALKFSSGGNVVVSVESRDKGEVSIELHFTVSDEGIGMSDDQVAQIFQPFVQADPSTTRRFGGTGLGLTISRHLVELLGGRIWVESAPGVGSTFHFTARFQHAADRRQQGTKAFASKLAAHAHLPVLVVDDNPLARQILVNLIGQLGLPVVAVDNGADAIALMQDPNHPPFLTCLVDWLMPAMDGIETMNSLRRAYSERQLVPPPMILVTAHSQDTALRSVLHHADGLLTKPVSGRNLFEEIARCIGLEEAMRPRHAAPLAEPLQWNRFQSLDILLVEDMEINRDVIGELLFRVGLHVRMAANGKEAIDEVQRKVPDVIFMDCQMPVMDGFTATRLLRSDPKLAHIVIIALTASATADDKRRCVASGMNGFVTKPVQLEQLYQQLAQSLPSVEADTTVSPDVMKTASPDPIEALPAFPGIDVALGLSQVGGRIPLFLKVLKKFRDNLGRYFESQFAAALESSDWVSADRLVHSLKGISKTLGAADLADATLLLERAVGQRKPDLITPVFLQVRSHLQLVCNGLQNIDASLQESVILDDDPSNGHVILNRLEQLANLLSARDAEAVDLASTLNATLRYSPFQSAWIGIFTSIERYEFAAADAALSTLLLTVKDATSQP